LQVKLFSWKDLWEAVSSFFPIQSAETVLESYAWVGKREGVQSLLLGVGLLLSRDQEGGLGRALH